MTKSSPAEEAPSPQPDEPTGEPEAASSDKPVYVKVRDRRPADAESTCLRPLGLCTLGGCCDVCWYRPDHPRFQKQADEQNHGDDSEQ